MIGASDSTGNVTSPRKEFDVGSPVPSLTGVCARRGCKVDRNISGTSSMITGDSGSDIYLIRTGSNDPWQCPVEVRECRRIEDVKQ
jgi:hypothetical protein